MEKGHSFRKKISTISKVNRKEAFVFRTTGFTKIIPVVNLNAYLFGAYCCSFVLLLLLLLEVRVLLWIMLLLLLILMISMTHLSSVENAINTENPNPDKMDN
jgi:hypothetical protein